MRSPGIHERSNCHDQKVLDRLHRPEFDALVVESLAQPFNVADWANWMSET